MSASAVVKRGATAFVSGKVVNGDRSAGMNAKLALYKNGQATGMTVKADAGGNFVFSMTARSPPSTGRLAARQRTQHASHERYGDYQGQVDREPSRSRRLVRRDRVKNGGRGGHIRRGPPVGSIFRPRFGARGLLHAASWSDRLRHAIDTAHANRRTS